MTSKIIQTLEIEGFDIVLSGLCSQKVNGVALKKCQFECGQVSACFVGTS